HPSLVWQDVTGRGRLDRAARPGWLGVCPPEGCDLWPEANLDAPRLMARVQGDYIAQTRVDLGNAIGTGAGLLVWQDETHFVRLEVYRDQTLEQRAVMVLEACVAGSYRNIGRGHCERRPMWLRVERVGEEVWGLCSVDGEHWLTCGSVRIPQRKE